MWDCCIIAVTHHIQVHHVSQHVDWAWAWASAFLKVAGSPAVLFPCTLDSFYSKALPDYGCSSLTFLHAYLTHKQWERVHGLLTSNVCCWCTFSHGRVELVAFYQHKPCVDLCWFASHIWKKTPKPQFSISNIYLHFRLQQASGFI